MIPHFTNTAALWALLAIPLIIAIHFLQHKTKTRLTATLFLLEALSPESHEGNAWDRLRTSRAFWMQILAVLLLTWVLAAPTWPGKDAARTVVFILDDSADMIPFRQEAARAVSEDMDTILQSGIPTTWVLTGSRTSGQPLYRGRDARQALRALDLWQPHEGTHDLSPALRTAAAIAGPTGITRLITSTAQRVPTGQSARGVGKPLGNIGFAGITPVEGGGGGHWRITVKNNSDSPLQSAISVHTEKGASPARIPLFLNPGTVTEWEYSLPPDCGRAMLQLPPDAFPADNALLLVRTIPKPVTVGITLPKRAERTFRNIIGSLPGFSPAPAGSSPSLLLLEEKREYVPDPGSTAVVLAGGGKPSSGVVTAERDPLTDGLNWSGLLVPSIGLMIPGEKARVLLWKGQEPLAWVDGETLFLNWPWEKSNADRVPAPLLMIRRFMQSVQEKLPGTRYGNLPGGTLLSMPAGGKLIHTTPGGERRETVFSGRLPGKTGYVEILLPETGKTPLFQGSVWFSDARMGDFSRCSTFDTGLPLPHEETLRHIKRDPLASLWLALAGLALIISWLPSTPDRPPRP